MPREETTQPPLQPDGGPTPDPPGPRGRRVAAVLLTIATCLLLGIARREAFAIALPLEPFSAQAPGGYALLTVRVGLLAALTWTLLQGPSPRVGTFATLSAFFLASLALKLLVAPFAFASVSTILRANSPPLPWPRAARAGALAAGAVAVAALSLWSLVAMFDDGARTSAALGPPDDAARWAARGNLFRARWSANHAARTASPEREENVQER